MVHSEIGTSWSVPRFDHSIYQFREPATKLSIKDNFDVRALTHSRIYWSLSNFHSLMFRIIRHTSLQTSMS